jgi:beta-glucosidase
VDMKQVDIPMALQAGNGVRLSLATVAIGTDYDQKVTCAE